jgi:hypothetical protein
MWVKEEFATSTRMTMSSATRESLTRLESMESEASKLLMLMV